MVVGGTIPAEDIVELKKLGVAAGLHARRADGRDRRVPAVRPRSRVMAGAGLRISVDDRVAVVTIDRPDALNALNTVLLEELLATLTDLGGDAGSRRDHPDGRGRPVVHRRRRHQGDGGEDAARGARLLRARTGDRPHARDDAQADDRRRERLRPRRRLRDGAGLRRAARLRERPLRPARDQPRHHPRLGRDPAARPRDEHRLRQGADPDRAHDRRRRGARARPRPARLPGRRAHAAGARDGPPDGVEEPRRALLRQGGVEPLAPGRHRREPRPRGRSLLDHVLDRRRPRGPERLRREAPARASSASSPCAAAPAALVRLLGGHGMEVQAR